MLFVYESYTSEILPQYLCICRKNLCKNSSSSVIEALSRASILPCMESIAVSSIGSKTLNVDGFPVKDLYNIYKGYNLLGALKYKGHIKYEPWKIVPKFPSLSYNTTSNTSQYGASTGHWIRY